MASNRKVQRLLIEFMDLLSDTNLEQSNVAITTSTEMNLEQSNVAITTSTEMNLEQTNVATTTDKMDTDLPMTQRAAPKTLITDQTPSMTVNDRDDPAPPAVQSTDHVEPSTPLKDPIDSAQEGTDEAKIKSVPPPTDQMNLDPPASVESEPLIPSTKEKVS